MDLYRVFPYNPNARKAESGHPEYVFPFQGAGRWDNPNYYLAWYLSFTEVGAVGETFGNLARWSPAMLEIPFLPGGQRALAVFQIPDDTPLLNLDDTAELLKRNVQPSQIVIRNLDFTQPLALSVFNEKGAAGNRRYAGLTWWSYHRPQWRNLTLWETSEQPTPLELKRVEPLSFDSVHIINAAKALNKELYLP